MPFMSSTLRHLKAVLCCISPFQDACFTGQQLKHFTNSHAHRVTMWVADPGIVLVPGIDVLTRGVERLHLEVLKKKVSYLRPLSLLEVLLSRHFQ